jgi:repressor LexA
MELLTSAQQELYDWLVQYINENQHAPSIRQMMIAMRLRSPAPVQSRLERLRNKGYITWTEGKARTIRILNSEPKGILIMGTIEADGIIKFFDDTKYRVDFCYLSHVEKAWGLVVSDNITSNDSIIVNDIAVMRPFRENEVLAKDQIIVAKIEKHKIILKRYSKWGNMAMLKSISSDYQLLKVEPNQLTIEGVLIGIWKKL